jgi:hypothetical protein
MCEVLMTTYIDVSFRGLVRDPSIEAAIHRWVARLEAMRLEIQRASVIVEPSGRKRTLVSTTVRLVDGTVRTSATVHADTYVGVADAFRAILRQHQPMQQRVPPRRLAFA